jgi:hypothetical protein
MNFDIALFGLLLCGIGLAAACYRSEYVALNRSHMRGALTQPIVSRSPRNLGLAASDAPDRHHERDATYDQ